MGISHDTIVIVKNRSAQEIKDWRPDAQTIEIWENIWRMQGHMESACLDKEKDGLTGLVRYYTLCDPRLREKSSIYLMNQRPDPELPRPSSQSYIRATCSIGGSVLTPEAGAYMSCIHIRMTPWGDQIQFRLSGQNVALMDGVERYLVTLLEGWRETGSANQS